MEQLLLEWYAANARDLPWRRTRDPYAILVSEVMLQQTQVERVVPKFRQFLRTFPTWRSLASAPVADVLKIWQGMGYNRRALILRRCAQAVVGECNGRLPRDPKQLERLPGLGPYTASAVCVFAFNMPVPMIETNIRRTYIHHFFPRSRTVSDDRLMPLIEATMDRDEPREWFSALMDYGSHLARTVPNPNRRSARYVRQTAFMGSDRQIRGEIIRHLSGTGRVTQSTVMSRLGVGQGRASSVFSKLEQEGFITRCSHRRCINNPHWGLRS